MTAPDPIATHNERVKLRAGALNTLGLGLVAYAVLRPLIDHPDRIEGLQLVLWGCAGVALHRAADYILGKLRKEADK